MSALSKPSILKHYEVGNIVIDPFIEEHLGNCSYDVMLGDFFFVQQQRNPDEFFNPFDEADVKLLWGEAKEARPAREFRCKQNPLRNIEDHELIIPIYPNETILAHTINFVGGQNGLAPDFDAITTSMRARSSLGRVGLTVCKDAGWGDIGYINRWTMEITNFGNYPVPAVVGMRVAQIIFYQTQPVAEDDLYKGKYQTKASVQELKERWQPTDMLPRLYSDPDVGKFKKYFRYI